MTDLPSRDTVSVTLAWIFYYLTAHPEIRAKLYGEIKPAYDKTVPGEFSDADLSNLDYLHGVINEALRIKPVAGECPFFKSSTFGTMHSALTIDGRCSKASALRA